MSFARSMTLLAVLLGSSAVAQDGSFQPRRCEVIPQPDLQTSLQIDGVEKARWHFGEQYSGPFFYPLRSPRGGLLTRMGHPGASNHDHHRSVWFAHHDVDGIDFWSMQAAGRIRQKMWYCYVDDDDQCIMASQLGWYDGSGKEVMQQDTVAALLPLPDNQHALELQITLLPADGRSTVQLGKTNFGFLAVRVAKTLSVHFGGGQLTGSEGQQGEAALFGKPARWIDYSGPVLVGSGPERSAEVEGITYFDHPQNPRYPTSWHVREDGWMGAAFCLNDGYTLRSEEPLTLRYLLHAHAGPYDPQAAEAVHQRFAALGAFRIAKSTAKHQQYEVLRGGQ